MVNKSDSSPTPKPFPLYSLSEYVDKINEKYQNKDRKSAATMALALPLFELSSAFRHSVGTVFRIPGCIIKIPSYLFFFFAPTSSFAFTLNTKLLGVLPGPIDVIKSAAKASFCASGIFWAPVIGAIRPDINARIHHFAGFSPIVKEGKKIEQLKPEPVNAIAGKGFDGIVGMDSVKEQMQAVIDGLRFLDVARAYKIGVPNGILFDGPPGCGKTYLVKKFVEEAEKQLGKKVSFHEIAAAKTGSALVHETSKNMQAVFDAAAEAAEANNSLAVVFIDEIDTIVPKASPFGERSNQSEERGTFLQCVEGAGKKNILVLAATNHPDKIDEAAIRSGRFDYKIHIPLPDKQTTLHFMEQFFDGIPIEDGVDFSAVVEKFDGMNVAEIKARGEIVSRLAFQKTIMARLNDPEAPMVVITQEMLNAAYIKPGVAVPEVT